MIKLAFYDITVAKNKSRDAQKSELGYVKEKANMAAGATIGGAAGATIGGIGGGLAAGPAGFALGTLAGGAIGATSGAYKSLKKTEEGSGSRKSSKGKFFGRAAAAAGMGAGGAAAGTGLGALAGYALAKNVGVDSATTRKWTAAGAGIGALAGGATGAEIGDRAVRNSGRKSNYRPKSHMLLAQYR